MSYRHLHFIKGYFHINKAFYHRDKLCGENEKQLNKISTSDNYILNKLFPDAEYPKTMQERINCFKFTSFIFYFFHIHTTLDHYQFYKTFQGEIAPFHIMLSIVFLKIVCSYRVTILHFIIVTLVHTIKELKDCMIPMSSTFISVAPVVIHARQYYKRNPLPRLCNFCYTAGENY